MALDRPAGAPAQRRNTPLLRVKDNEALSTRPRDQRSHPVSRIVLHSRCTCIAPSWESWLVSLWSRDRSEVGSNLKEVLGSRWLAHFRISSNAGKLTCSFPVGVCGRKGVSKVPPFGQRRVRTDCVPRRAAPSISRIRSVDETVSDPQSRHPFVVV